VTPALAAHALTKRYGSTAAVDALDLTVERGELYGFLGPNGAGKTTTIRMALGLIAPSAGDVDLLGERVRPDRAPLERVGALVEEPAFWRYLSGRRNLEYLARAGGGRADVRARLGRIDEVLEVVGLAEAADKRVKAYSQGMRQRLGVALALVGAPDLLVLDEPTNGLDPSGMREMRLLLRRLADDGTTIFVSSHLLAEVEAMCDRVGVMAQGRLVAEGAPSSLRGAPDRVRVEVDDVRRAARVIAEIQGVTTSTNTTPTGAEGAGVVWVTLSDGVTSAGVNAALVGAGLAVQALVPEGSSLEDVFLELVEGADVPR
jgi:ABC-2 type transport system ATP-binding protein